MLGPNAKEALDGAGDPQGVTCLAVVGHSCRDIFSRVLVAYHSAHSSVFIEEGVVDDEYSEIGVEGRSPPSGETEIWEGSLWEEDVKKLLIVRMTQR